MRSANLRVVPPRYWLNRIGLVLLALPLLGTVAAAVLGGGAARGARGVAMPPSGVVFGLLMNAGVWFAAWSNMRRQEAKARAQAPLPPIEKR